jgi:ankyrin repeat protein
MDYNDKNLIKDKKLYLNTIKSLINAGVDINAKNNEGLTALHIAPDFRIFFKQTP